MTTISTSTPDIVLLYITTEHIEQARLLGRTLLGERLAACINILPHMESHYHWQGDIAVSQECVLIVKTTTAHVADVRQRIAALHTYDVPCILEVPILSVNAPYFAWLHEQMA